MTAGAIIFVFLGLLLAPLFPGVINRTKAVFAGRVGQPLFQTYFDLFKLLRKGAVYSRTTSWVFRAGPVVGLASTIVVMALLPVGGIAAPLAFHGDIVLLAYLLGLARFFTVIAALDTGSAFEGMGASREVAFSAIAEPALFLGFAALVRMSGELSLNGIFAYITPDVWVKSGPSLALVAAGIFLVFLAENARIPVDDPNTHLELTMIHEVMVLDHSGPDLAFITYGSSLKLWILGGLLVNMVVPVRTGVLWVDGAAFLAGLMVLAVLVGCVESTMSRLKLVRVPQILIVAGSLCVIALVFSFG